MRYALALLVLSACSASTSETDRASSAPLVRDDERAARVVVTFEEGTPPGAPSSSPAQDGGPALALADACTWDLADAGCE